MNHPPPQSDRPCDTHSPDNLPSEGTAEPAGLVEPRHFPDPHLTGASWPRRFADRWHTHRRVADEFRQAFSDASAAVRNAPGEIAVFLPEELWRGWHQDWVGSLFIGRPTTHDRLSADELAASVEDVHAGVEAVSYVRDVLGDVRVGHFFAYVFPERIGPPELLPTLEEVAHRTPGFYLQAEDAFRPTRMHYWEFLNRIGFLLTEPTPAEWGWLERVAYEVVTSPRTLRPGREEVWAREVFRAVIRPLSVRLSIKSDPRVVDPSVGFEELILLAHNWCVDARAAVQRMTGRRHSDPSASPTAPGASHSHDPEPVSRPHALGHAGSPPAVPPEPDGLFGVSGFRYGGVPVEFKRAALQYRLIRLLWDGEDGRPKAAQEVEPVMAELWGEEHDREDYNFRQLCDDARGKLEKENCPITITHRNGRVQLTPFGP